MIRSATATRLMELGYEKGDDVEGVDSGPDVELMYMYPSVPASPAQRARSAYQRRNLNYTVRSEIIRIYKFELLGLKKTMRSH